MTLHEYRRAAERYLSAMPSMKKSQNTVRMYRQILNRYAAYLEAEQISEAGPLSVVGWRVALFGAGLSSNTVRYDMTVLHGFFEWAVRMRLCDGNPVDTAEIPEQKAPEYNLLTREEIRQLLRERPRGVYRKHSERNRAIILLLLQAGMRNSELRGLRPCDLNFEQNTITVRHGKGDRSREIAFPALSQSAVRAYLASGARPAWAGDAGPLFGTDADATGHSTGGTEWHPLSSAALLGIVNRYVEHCTGHRGVKVHALRHAAASLWDDMGIPMRTIQTVLGHASIRTTEQIYVRILDKSKAAQQVNRAFDGADFA